MKEFWFCLNTKVYFGCGILEGKLGEVASLGRRALIVTGYHFAKASGLLGRIKKVFRAKGIESFEFCEAEENPSFQTVDRGGDAARKNRCDVIVGVGGGSAMDVAKGISILATNEGPSKIYAGEDKFNNIPLPIVAVPTTAGTGSEVTRFAVLTDREDNTKKTISSLSIMPKLSICDPELTLTLSPRLTASTGMDAISHAIEGYLSKNTSPVSDVLGIEAIRLAFSNLEEAVRNGHNLVARTNMLLSSFMAGMSLNHTGTILGHGMGYALTLDYGLQHGEANGLILPYLMEYIYEKKKDRMENLMDITGGAPWEVLKRLLRDISLPVTLSEIGVTGSRVEGLLQRMIDNSSRSLQKIDFPFGEDDFRKVIELAL